MINSLLSAKDRLFPIQALFTALTSPKKLINFPPAHIFRQISR